MPKNDPITFDCPDPLSSKYKTDANASHYCKVCDTWKRRSKFSKKYEKENVCRNCAPSYVEGQRQIAKSLWAMYDAQKQES